MMAGAVLSYFVLGPMVATFGEKSLEPIPPAEWEKPPEGHAVNESDKRPDPQHGSRDHSQRYLLFIGAGAVAAGGIISMLRAMPLIIGSITGGLRDSRAAALPVTRSPSAPNATCRSM